MSCRRCAEKKKWDGVGKDCTIEDWTHENRKLFCKKKEKKKAEHGEYSLVRLIGYKESAIFESRALSIESKNKFVINKREINPSQLTNSEEMEDVDKGLGGTEGEARWPIFVFQSNTDHT